MLSIEIKSISFRGIVLKRMNMRCLNRPLNRNCAVVRDFSCAFRKKFFSNYTCASTENQWLYMTLGLPHKNSFVMLIIVQSCLVSEAPKTQLYLRFSSERRVTSFSIAMPMSRASKPHEIAFHHLRSVRSLTRRLNSCFRLKN